MGWKYLPYDERLKQLKLPTLVYRRRRGDMLLTHKLSNDTSSLLNLNMSYQSHTRGHSKKLPKCHVNTRMRQNFFSERIVNDWNFLSESTVSVTSPITVKKSLDSEWSCRNWKYCWQDPDQQQMSVIITHRATQIHWTLSLWSTN